MCVCACECVCVSVCVCECECVCECVCVHRHEHKKEYRYIIDTIRGNIIQGFIQRGPRSKSLPQELGKKVIIALKQDIMSVGT